MTDPILDTCICGCGQKFAPKKDRLFYSAACRARYSRAKKHDGEITGMRALKRGGWSITVKFPHQPDGLNIGSKVRLKRAD